MNLNDIYDKILEDFENKRELISKFYQCEFNNYEDCLEQGNKLFNITVNDVLALRKYNELYYHTYLKNQLFSNLQAIKYYNTIDIRETRRIVSTSDNCISTIHILVRDTIYLNIYFRSSDFDGALSADLEFMCTLPKELITHLRIFKGSNGYQEVTDDLINKLQNMPIKLSMMFGSLHRTN